MTNDQRRRFERGGLAPSQLLGNGVRRLEAFTAPAARCQSLFLGRYRPEAGMLSSISDILETLALLNFGVGSLLNSQPK